MASPPPRINVLFKASSSGYLTAVSVGGSTYLEGTFRRKELVKTIFAYIQRLGDPRAIVRMYPNYSTGPGEKFYSISAHTVTRIVAETISVEDMCIGELGSFLETQLWTAISQLIPTREIPGTKLWECALCGRGTPMVEFKGTVPLETSLSTHCLYHPGCGTTYLVIDKFRGLCTDLVETARQNESAERFFVNQPWNSNPPWLSREDLFQLFKES